ncbi:MAG: hypothetical protein RL577_1177 [Bacteroidota bacterium]|jgi:hypothetical protein
MTVRLHLFILLLSPILAWAQNPILRWKEKQAWSSLKQEHSKEALVQFAALCQNPKSASASNFLGWALAFSEPDRRQNLDSAWWAVDSSLHLYLASSQGFHRRGPANWKLLDSLYGIRSNYILEHHFPTNWESYCSGLATLNHIQSHALDSWSHIESVYQFWQPLYQSQHDSLEAAPVLNSFDIEKAVAFTSQASARWKGPLQDSIHQWAWRLACQVHTEAAYQAYFETYPNSPYHELALSKADERAYFAAVESADPEAYNRYLNDYPSGQFTSRSQFYLAYTSVKPVPVLLPSKHYKYVDSSTMKVWLNDSFDFAWPFQLKENRAIWTENGATFFTQHGLTLVNDQQGNGKYSYINKAGEKRELQQGYTVFDELIQASPQLLFVRVLGQWGCYHSSDQWILNPAYSELKIDTAHSVLFARSSQGWRLFDYDGKALLDQPLPESNFQETGSIQLSLPSLYWIVELPDGNAILNARTMTLSTERYSEISEFKKGVAVASMSHSKAILDSSGVRFSAPSIEEFVGNWAVYQNELGLYGVIDRSFVSVLPAKHKSIQLFSSTGPHTKHAIVYRPQSKNSALRLLNNSVQTVSTPEPIIEAMSLGNSLLLLLCKKGYYLYSIQSESIQNSKPFDFVVPISKISFLTFSKDSDTFSLWVDRAWMGCRIQRPDSRAINKVPIALDRHLLLLESRGKKGVWNPTLEQWELSPLYDEIIALDNGTFLTTIDGQSAIESKEGKLLICQAQDASGLQFPGYYLILTDLGPTWISTGGQLY